MANFCLALEGAAQDDDFPMVMYLKMLFFFTKEAFKKVFFPLPGHQLAKHSFDFSTTIRREGGEKNSNPQPLSFLFFWLVLLICLLKVMLGIANA